MATLKTTQTNQRHVITLVKGEQRWRFHLEPGLEGEMIDLLADCAGDPTHPLDWFDAAIVSHQIARRLEDASPDVHTKPQEDGGPDPAAEAA